MPEIMFSIPKIEPHKPRPTASEAIIRPSPSLLVLIGLATNVLVITVARVKGPESHTS